MLKDQCISVTDLRTKTKHCLEGVAKEPKYIFVNNKPVAVIINVVEYEKICRKPNLIEFGNDEIDADLLAEAAIAKKIPKKNLINIR